MQIRRVHAGMDGAVVLAIGDSSHANVGKNKTGSQAGLVVLVAENRTALLRGEKVKINFLYAGNTARRLGSDTNDSSHGLQELV